MVEYRAIKCGQITPLCDIRADQLTTRYQHGITTGRVGIDAMSVLLTYTLLCYFSQHSTFLLVAQNVINCKQISNKINRSNLEWRCVALNLSYYHFETLQLLLKNITEEDSKKIN